MATFLFENNLGAAAFNVQGDACMTEQLPDTSGSFVGKEPFCIIQKDQNLYVDVNWRCSGSLMGSIIGHWHVGLFLERIGPGRRP